MPSNQERDPSERPGALWVGPFLGLALVACFSWTALLDPAGWSEALSRGLNSAVLIEFGAKVDALVGLGEVDRLLLSVFLHQGWEHLLLNLSWLMGLAWLAKKLGFSGPFFFASFVLSALGGQLASTLVAMGPSVGASGGIYGLIGAMALSLWQGSQERRARTALVVSLLGILLLPLLMADIDHAAHCGGFITGFLLSHAHGRRLGRCLPWAAVFLLLATALASVALPRPELHLPALEGQGTELAPESCKGLGDTHEASCLWERGLFFAAEASLEDILEIEAGLAPYLPPRGRCVRLRLDSRLVFMKRERHGRLFLLTVDPSIWPRVGPSARRLIDARCPGR